MVLDACINQSPSKRVLVVEDEPAVMRFVVIQLNSLGYETKTASTLKEALARLDQERFDLLFTDIALPKGEGGLELAEWVQATQPRCLIPGCGGTVDHDAAREALWARFFTEAPARQRQSFARSSYIKSV